MFFTNTCLLKSKKIFVQTTFKTLSFLNWGFYECNIAQLKTVRHCPLKVTVHTNCYLRMFPLVLFPLVLHPLIKLHCEFSNNICFQSFLVPQVIRIYNMFSYVKVLNKLASYFKNNKIYLHARRGQEKYIITFVYKSIIVIDLGKE